MLATPLCGWTRGSGCMEGVRNCEISIKFASKTRNGRGSEWKVVRVAGKVI